MIISPYFHCVILTENCRDEFDKVVPEIVENKKTEFKPALEVYKHAYRFLMIWHKRRDEERFIKLCRYLVATLESDSPKLSYVGVALSKPHVIRWISHMNDVLWKCCECLEELKPEYANDMKWVLLYLRVLVSFTSTNTWAMLKNKNMEAVRSSMNQLCTKLMGQLVPKGFYLTLKVQYYL